MLANKVGWALPTLPRYILIISVLILTLIILDLIYPVTLTDDKQQFAKVITAEDGTPLRSFADKQGVWRYPVKINEVSPLYLQALINYEDRWYWSHPGINPIAMFRALYQNIRNKRIVSGGSTLTMQVARLLSPHSRSIRGKLKQIIIALQLEWHFSKEQILSYYLNHAPFGGTIEGLQAASYTYLGKSASELSHAEAALLTVLPQAPSRNRPDRHPDRALKVRNKVIHRLASQSVWSNDVIKQALLEPVIAQHNKPAIIAPLLTRRLKVEISDASLIKTTLDIDMQMGVEDRLKHYIEHLPEKTSAAVLIVENKSLKVKAYAGSADFFNPARFGHVDMVKAIRSPGSTLKPFLYGIAIDEGLIHSESLLIDAPLSFDGYKPQNFSRGFTGPVSVSQALQRSLNIPAVQVLYHLSPELFVSRLKNSGLKLQLTQSAKPNLSVILGGVGSTLETLVGSYTALANKGLAGKIRYTKNNPMQQRYLLSPASAWIIYNILSTQRVPHPAGLAWKTGTSYGHRDFWSIGVTADYTIGVWIGRPDGTPLPGHFGAHTASPLLFSIVEKLASRSTIKQADKVIKNSICWPLGGLENETSSSLCHQKKQAWIVDNNVPLTLASHQQEQWQSNPLSIQINAETGLTINNTCETTNSINKDIALWPLVIEPWIANNFQRHSQIGKFDPSCDISSIYTSNEIKIEGLEDNTILRSAGASQQLPRIKLKARGGQGLLYWFINGHLKYSISNNKVIFHQFKSAGSYQITVLDDAGHSDSIKLNVL